MRPGYRPVVEPRFVGRTTELGEAIGQLDDALAGHTRVVLVSGEAGIGKTRLVTELCRLGGTRAVPTLWGACSEDGGAPAFWPWRRILRAWQESAAPAERARLAPLTADLARIAPELGPPAPDTGGLEQRFVLFDAMTRFLTAAAAPGGLVVVLDDVQWADAASSALLAHLASALRDARLVLVVSYREAPAVAADLARVPGALALELRGLDRDAVASALTDRIGAQPAPQVVADVVRRTGGNPFFVEELGRALRSTDATAPVPGAVRDVVRRRLSHLPAACRELLDVGAVIGREPGLALLAAAAGRPVDEVLDALAPAEDNGVLERPPGRIGLRFAHDLVREAVLDDLAPGRRARLHLQVADALAAAATDPDVLPELAHHALAALPLGDAAAAVAWARGAAVNAQRALAHEDAARLFARAVGAARQALEPGERGVLLIVAAQAHAAANDVTTATDLASQAVELGRRIHAAELVGEAALVLPGVSDLPWLRTSRGWCEEALRTLPDRDSPLVAQLHAQRCHALMPDADHAGMGEASARALAMAERLDDAAALTAALRARQLARAGADGNAERLTLGGRMIAIGTRTRDDEATLWGHLWRFDALLQAGRVADGEAELDLIASVAQRMRTPMARFHEIRGRVAMAFGRGQFARAAELNAQASAIGMAGGHEGARIAATGVGLSLALFSGAPIGDVSWLEAIAAQDTPFVFLPRSALALWYLSVGRRAAAQHWYAQLPPVGSTRPPVFMAFVLDAQRAMLACDLGDAASAELCHRQLLPYADLHVVSGAGAVTTAGSVQLYLGLAAHGAGRFDAAVRHLRSAISANQAAGLLPFVAIAQHRLAVALRRRDRAGDVDEAAALLAEAGATAERLGMPPLQAQIAQERAEPPDGALTRRENEIAELVAAGLTNKQIAARAHISERTVETHVQHVLAKLGFTGRSQIAAWVTRRAG